MCRKLCFIGLVVAYLSGCTKSTNNVDNTAAPELSRSAARLHAITEDQTDVVPATEFQKQTSGTVLELPANAVNIKNDEFPDGMTVAISPDVDIWLDGEKIELSAISIGDQVDLFSEQKGNRADGYQSLVTRINVAHSTAKDDATNDYSIKLKGIVVEANENSVTIRDQDLPDAEPTILPVVRLVKVVRHGEAGGTSLLKPGDKVTLESQSRGNRQDGYIDVVTRITVEADVNR